MANPSLLIDLQPQVLKWARERARLDQETLARKINVKPETIQAWEQSGRISLSQVDKLANFTHTPLGFLYLPQPVQNELTIPDFRTVGDAMPQYHSPELIETVNTMQRRQDWLRDELIEQGYSPLPLVGGISGDAPPVEAATLLRDFLGLEPQWAASQPNWGEALRYLRDAIETAGVIVVFNGIVGNNTHRKLDPSEFRGFALVDNYAPFIFVNAADAKAAQMFTLIHELAHIGIAATGISTFDQLEPLAHPTEIRCNAIAAEFLVPAADLQTAWQTVSHHKKLFDSLNSLARRFKVSSLVIARRALDLGLIDRDTFFAFYQSQQVKPSKTNAAGGNFWHTQNTRIGRPLGTAIVRAVKEGRLLYREAYSLTGLKSESFEAFMQKMEAQV